VKCLGGLIAASVLLAACGGSSGTLTVPTTTGGGGTGTGGGTTPTTQIGATIAGTFTPNAIGVSLPAGPTLSNGGSTQLTVEFRAMTTSALVSDLIVVGFTSASPTGTVVITPNSATTADGTASATYRTRAATT
jgi:hypothetical protein